MRTSEESTNATEVSSAFDPNREVGREHGISPLRGFFRELAFQDIAAPLFHSYMAVRAYTAPPGPHLAGDPLDDHRRDRCLGAWKNPPCG